MKKQHGYIDLDGIVTMLIVIGVIVGVVLAYGVPWLWDFIKPIIHSLTA